MGGRLARDLRPASGPVSARWMLHPATSDRAGPLSPMEPHPMTDTSSRDRAAQLVKKTAQALELLTVFRLQRGGVTTRDVDEFNALLKDAERLALLGGFPVPPRLVDGLVGH